MKLLKNISMVAVSVTALFVVIGLFLPSKWQVTRSLVISASKERIYGQIASLPEWQKWSPWNSEQDQSLEFTYSGPQVGLGAQENWTSKKMGSGWLKIVKADPEVGIEYELFIDMKKFQSTILGSMAFESVGDQTNVIWVDQGDSGNNIFKRWMSLTMNRVLGGEMDKGLRKLQQVVLAMEPEEAPVEVVAEAAEEMVVAE